MGLSAAQAKYLFISSRIIDVQGALMTNSMKQLALTDKSSDIAEAKEYALNAQQWQFNGNAQFDYNTLMDNEYFVVTNDDKNRVVLNGLYAAAANSAKVNPNGSAYSVEGLNAFMMAMGQTPKYASSWIDLYSKTITQDSINRENAIALDNTYKTNATDFINKYGTPNPEKVTTTTNVYSSVTNVSDLLKKMGNLGSIGQLSTRDVNMRNYTWSRILGGNRTAGTKDDSNYSFYNAVYNGKGDDVIVMLQSNGSFKDSNNIKTAQNRFVEIAHTIIDKIANALGGDKTVLRNNLESYVEILKNSIANTGAMRDADRDGDDWAQMALLGGDQCGSYLNLSELIRLLIGHVCGISVSENYAAKDDSEWSNRIASDGSHLSSNNRKNFNINASFQYQTGENSVSDYEKNDKGYTYPEWLNQWNNLNEYEQTYAYKNLTSSLKGKVNNPNKKVQIPTLVVDNNLANDFAVLEKYQRIFQKICSQGWTEDKDLAQDKLANKLENAQYLIQYQDNKAATMSMFAEFEKVNANNKDDIERYYDAEERKIKSEETRLGVEQTALQTELSSLQTEEASVKSIIDKNVERGFNLFG